MRQPNPIVLPVEKEWLQNIAAGDERAFYELYTFFTPVLRAYILKATRSGSDTEEILQETFIRIWMYRDHLTEVENLTAWIYTVAARVSLNYLRAVLNYRKKLRELALPGHHPSVELLTPLEITNVEAIQAAIEKSVGQLSPKQRQVYRMSREEGLKPAAIAEIFAVPVGTVKNQLSAALKQIRADLTAAGYEIGLLLFIFSSIS